MRRLGRADPVYTASPAIAWPGSPALSREPHRSLPAEPRLRTPAWWLRAAAGALLGWVALFRGGIESRGDEASWDQYQQLVERIAAEVAQLPVSDAKLRTEVARLRELLLGPPRIFPEKALSPSPCPAVPEKTTPEERRFWDFRRQKAAQLFALAQAAYQANDLPLCYEALSQVVLLDPDHARARASLGYACRFQHWVTPYQANRLSSGFIWHPLWGWVAEASLPRYEQGLRPVHDRWLPAGQAERLRSQWNQAWVIETDHYQVRTNAGLEEGVRLATELEQCYGVFSRLFAGYGLSEEQLRAAFGGQPSRARLFRPPRGQFIVHLYRNREEFQKRIARFRALDQATATGLYVPSDRIVYCYRDEELEGGWLASVLHEATHQLFVEATARFQFGPRDGNYWVVEGVAAYMESLHRRNGWLLVGSWDTPRLKLAREQLVQHHRYIPLNKLVELTAQDFARRDSSFLYGQSALVVHFLLHCEKGKYRRVLLSFLEEVLSGRASPDTLSKMLGMSYEDIDRHIVVHVGKKVW
jgi:hypothetical protein